MVLVAVEVVATEDTTLKVLSSQNKCESEVV